MAAIVVTGWEDTSNAYRGSTIDASYQVSVHMAKQLQRRRFFRNLPIRNKITTEILGLFQKKMHGGVGRHFFLKPITHLGVIHNCQPFSTKEKIF
jgi:uncharacterized protein YegJ (DUF2314 family)